jgi:hypothetical protein
MIESKEVISNKQLPDWIKNHKVFKEFDTINKVFPEIGLPNCEEEIEVNNLKEAKKCATTLVSDIKSEINSRISTINRYAKRVSLSSKREEKIKNCVEVLGKIKAAINPDKVIKKSNNKLTLNLHKDISKDKEVLFKSGEGLFKVYNKVNNFLNKENFLDMEKLDNLDSFKEFSTKNVPVIKYKIVFSSDGMDGLWDIATMSMRGVTSCQTWGGGYSTGIVGSLVDPFTGIIYMTSGGKFNEYGTKMIRRCIVRMIVDDKTKKSSIILERMYPSLERPTLKKFMDFIKKKTGNKFNVSYFPDSRKTAGVYVPMNKAVKTLNQNEQPYRDSHLIYKSGDADITLDNDIKAYDFGDEIATKIIGAIKGLKETTIDKVSKAAINNLSNNVNYQVCLYNLIEQNISNKLNLDAGNAYKNVRQGIKKTDQKSLTLFKYKDELETYSKDVKGLITSSLKDINKTLASLSHKPRSKSGISDDVLSKIVSIAESKVKSFIDKELAKVSKSIKKTDPNDIKHIYTKLLN